MADNAKLLTQIEKRLSISREAELLHSFVRANVTDDEISKETTPIPKPDSALLVHQKPVNKTKKKSKGSNKTKKMKSVKQQDEKKVKRRIRRVRSCRQEEVYCDKDRAAAVNLGSKDIKHSLKMKKKQDRSKQFQIPEEAEPGTFLALGNYEMCRGDLKIALNFMAKALELNPLEKNALVARSKCYILLGQPQDALKDAEAALSIDHSFLKAIYQKAEALYYLGDFEYSLVFFHRGLHIRPDHEGFKLGVHKAQKAIENAIGSKVPIGLSMRSGESYSEANSQRSNKKKSRLLRELAPDKDYLDELINNPNIKCKFKEDNSKVAKYIQETVEYLNARQEFWRQQLPPKLK